MSDREWEYERLVAPIEDRMMRAVWRVTRHSDDAEDALQEALLTIWRRWDLIVRHPNPHALILHICINAGHDLLRRRVRQGNWIGQPLIPEHIPDSSDSALQSITSAEQHRQVLRAIGLLPKNQARAILMHAVEEVPYSDIAAALHCREVTVRKHVARARTRLRKLLSYLIPAIANKETSNA